MAYMGSNPKLKSIVSTGDTLANLTAETRVAGRLVYATDVPNKGFYWDDGTNLNKLGSGNGPAWGTILGTATEVASGDADESVLSTAITNTAAGGTIVILPSYIVVENITLNKEIHFEGRAGKGSAINGTLNVQTGADGSSFSNLQFKDDVTVDNGASCINASSNMYMANGKILTDNNITGLSAGNAYLLVRL